MSWRRTAASRKSKSSDVGAVTADGNVKIKSSNTAKVVTTNDSGGDLVLKGSSTVDGNITLDGRVIKIKGSRVEGNVRASGVEKIKDSMVEGPIEAEGDVETIKNSTVEGTIDAGGDVLLKGNTTVEGDVIATGTVRTSSGVTVTGTVKQT